MKEATQSGRKGLFIPPQAGSGIAGTLGAVVVLVFGVVFLTGLSLDRSQTAMVRFLAEKGVAILSALEGGVRSGARSRGGVRFQYLIEEVAARPDVRFIAVVMPDGTILAHSDPRRLGGVLFAEEGREFRPEELAALHPTETPSWAIVDMEGAPSFVVYKAFQPRSRHKEKKGTAFASGGEPCVFLGLDLAPLEAAQARDRKRALLIGGGVLLAGMMALLGLHALDRVRASRRGQRAAEALADKLAVTLPDGLVLLDARGRVVQLNNAALRLLGLDSPDASGSLPGTGGGGQTIGGVSGPRKPHEVLPSPLADLATRLVRGDVLPDTEVITPCGGRIRHLSVRGGHVNDGEKERLGSLMFLRDMTDVRRLEAAVRRREKLAAVGNLAAGVAHELRNPLSSIKGYATYFGGRFPEGSSDREAAEIMVREVDRLNRAIGDLVGLSRPTDVKPRPTDMARLIADILRLIEQDAAARSVRIRLEAPDDAVVLPVDPDRMRQVLLNVCLNALQAMPGGGDLALSLTAPPDADMACIEVRDTGEGIAPDVLPHIFDAYFTTKSQGTGLGLATAHKIMEAHGGGISVASEPGRGTLFRLYLPMRQAPPGDPAGSATGA